MIAKTKAIANKHPRIKRRTDRHDVQHRHGHEHVVQHDLDLNNKQIFIILSLRIM